MDIKRIIREEVNDFDWTHEIEEPYVLNLGTRYIIDACTTGYDEDTVKEKLEDLFGRHWDFIQEDIPKCNWFGNENIREVDHRVLLHLHIQKESPYIRRDTMGWDQCEHDGYWNQGDYTIISVDDFLNAGPVIPREEY